MGKKVFESAVSHIPIKLLDTVIIIGILAMALLIPILSANGGFTVSFEANGGSYVEPQYLRYGESIECPEEPTREEYLFCGWFYDAEGNRAFDFENAEAKGNITLYAVWREE